MIVDLNPTESQQLVVESIESVLANLLPIERLRKPEAGGAGAERTVWNDLAGLGLFGLGLPENAGGDGQGLPEEVLAARSLGRRCVSPGVIATMLAVHLADDEKLILAFREGRARAAFANPLANDEAHLIDAEACDWLVLLGSPPLLLPLQSTARERRKIRSMDESLALERVRIKPEAGNSSVDGTDQTSLLLSAYLVGNAQATLAMATAYACTREQFGEPIGAFQAIKHSCADMAVRAAGAEAQCLYAAVTVGSSGIDSTVEIACARWLAREAAVANAKANIQIHGAMGFTAECDAHLYLKRALAVANLGSDVGSEERRILGR